MLAALLILAQPAAPAAARALAPAEIVAAAPAPDWVTVPPADLLVMDLAADADGRARRVVIQLMPPPFSQAWVGNIRKLVAARWYDGVSVNRVQDNYVVQWGDADAEDKKKAKPLPPGLAKVPQSEYVASLPPLLPPDEGKPLPPGVNGDAARLLLRSFAEARRQDPVGRDVTARSGERATLTDAFIRGWPISLLDKGPGGGDFAPVHCYGMVGVGRDMPPDTGTGAELYVVIGQAPRHLDRNIALVGRVIEGIEHLSSLPRGTGPLGFYESPAQRVPIRAVRMGNEVAGLPRYQSLSTESASFTRYADARANRRDAFFIRPAGGADICNIPVPVRRAP